MDDLDDKMTLAQLIDFVDELESEMIAVDARMQFWPGYEPTYYETSQKLGQVYSALLRLAKLEDHIDISW